MYQQKYYLSIRDINYANHMDHLALLNYLHETRVRFLRSIQVSELDIDGNGSGIVVVNLECSYHKECFYGDEIVVELSLCADSATRLRFTYLVYKANREKNLIAKSAIIMVCMSSKHKVIAIPNNLLAYTS